MKGIDWILGRHFLLSRMISEEYMRELAKLLLKDQYGQYLLRIIE